MLIEPKDFAVTLVLASTKDPAAFGMENALGHQVIDCTRILKGRIELDQRVRPEATLIQAGSDERLDTFVSNSDEAANVGGIVADQPFAKFEYVHVAASVLIFCLDPHASCGLSQHQNATADAWTNCCPAAATCGFYRENNHSIPQRLAGVNAAGE